MQCQLCETLLPSWRRKWCSKTCLDKAREQDRSFSIECLWCSKTHQIPFKRRKRTRFCSGACARAHYNANNLRGERNGQWKGGRAIYYGSDWDDIRRIVRDRDRVCQECGKTPEENGRALDVHHTEPYRYSFSHDLAKLKAFCHPCRMRQPEHRITGDEPFLATPIPPRGPTKRETRRRQQAERATAARTQRAELQRKAIVMSVNGKSFRKIARELGVSHQTVANWLKGPATTGEDAPAYAA